jgi:hypothetical protein
MRTISRNLNPATVLATAALFVALGTGAASALPGKGSVDRNDIRANAVASKQVKNGAISGLDVADGATEAQTDECARLDFQLVEQPAVHGGDIANRA